MSEYKLYFLDARGHIERAKSLCCDGDAEAVRLGLNHPRHKAMELWHGTKLLRRFAIDGGETRNASDYIFYLMDNDRIVALTTIKAGDDMTAIKLAQPIFRACGDKCDAVEVWQRDRWIRTFLDQPQNDGPAAPATAGDLLVSLERAHQHLVVDREIRLQDSYAAIRHSRKLLDTIAKLKPMYGAFGTQQDGND